MTATATRSVTSPSRTSRWEQVEGSVSEQTRFSVPPFDAAERGRIAAIAVMPPGPVRERVTLETLRDYYARVNWPRYQAAMEELLHG